MGPGAPVMALPCGGLLVHGESPLLGIRSQSSLFSTWHRELCLRRCKRAGSLLDWCLEIRGVSCRTSASPEADAHPSLFILVMLPPLRAPQNHPYGQVTNPWAPQLSSMCGGFKGPPCPIGSGVLCVWAQLWVGPAALPAPLLFP